MGSSLTRPGGLGQNQMASMPRAQAPMGMPTTPAAPANWQAAHANVQFNPSGQPIQPQYDPRAYGFNTFGQAWSGANKFFHGPEYQAWLKAYNDPSRPATLADLQGGSSFYQNNP